MNGLKLRLGDRDGIILYNWDNWALRCCKLHGMRLEKMDDNAN